MLEEDKITLMKQKTDFEEEMNIVKQNLETEKKN